MFITLLVVCILMIFAYFIYVNIEIDNLFYKALELENKGNHKEAILNYLYAINHSNSKRKFCENKIK